MPPSVVERARLRAEAALTERAEAIRRKAAKAESDERCRNAVDEAELSTFERAKLRALEAVAAKQPGGTLPAFLEKVGQRVGAKFARPPGSPPLPAAAAAAAETVVLADSMMSVYYRPPTVPTPGGDFTQALLATDALTLIVTFAGLRAFGSFALVCHAWRNAVQAKAREWGVLSYVRAIGGGFGKRKSQLDTPTWLCCLPADDPHLGLTAAPTLAIVDTCNYRGKTAGAR